MECDEEILYMSVNVCRSMRFSQINHGSQNFGRYHSVAGREWSNIPTDTPDSEEGDLKDI